MPFQSSPFNFVRSNCDWRFRAITDSYQCVSASPHPDHGITSTPEPCDRDRSSTARFNRHERAVRFSIVEILVVRLMRFVHLKVEKEIAARQLSPESGVLC
ncbi:hypothetical protein [Burkholderia sp. Bp9131]|uniref:hypothetical protein n=1 Tax=Burkholderia sp. Bp9131 TaxID=2184571 RepID=UPI000F56009C|nr:hypothetical protein [Burkholderia sp. Bp9131]